MLNISGLQEGIVLDHIEAGKSLDIYYHLGLDKLDCQVAIIKNARSSKMGRKDIIKIEGGLDIVDLEMLGYIDHNITVNIIRGSNIAEKKRLRLPKKLTNVIQCKNPRCITSIEQEHPHRRGHDRGRRSHGRREHRPHPHASGRNGKSEQARGETTSGKAGTEVSVVLKIGGAA